MGADLILAFAQYRRELDSDEAWTQLVLSLTDDELARVIEYEYADHPSNKYDTDEWQELARAEVLMARTLVMEGRMVTGLIDSAGVRWIVGGGGSWGDTPDGYSEVCLIDGVNLVRPVDDEERV